MVCTTSTRRSPHQSSILLITCAIALAVTGPAAWPSLAHADHITVPPVPSNIQAPAGRKGIPRRARRRHPELHLPAGRLRLRVDALRTAGHVFRDTIPQTIDHS